MTQKPPRKSYKLMQDKIRDDISISLWKLSESFLDALKLKS